MTFEVEKPTKDMRNHLMIITPTLSWENLGDGFYNAYLNENQLDKEAIDEFTNWLESYNLEYRLV